MGSVSSTTSNLTSLLQTLATESPQLSSVLSTPKVQSALEEAAPQDIAELSEEAIQLQQVGLLFGSSGTTQSDPLTSAMDSLFSTGTSDTQTDPLTQLLETTLAAGSTDNGTGSTDQADTTLTDAQAQVLNTLYSTQPAVTSLLSVLG